MKKQMNMIQAVSREPSIRIIRVVTSGQKAKKSSVDYYM